MKPSTPAPFTPCRIIRDHFALSQSGFADMLDVSVHTVIKWENGSRAMPPIAIRLCDVLAKVKQSSTGLFDALAAPNPAPASSEPAPPDEAETPVPDWL